ncbi:hypothetical protein Tco_1372191, partial [Tanacetum coccineum]
ISRIVKTLVLAVFHMSFTSSASVWESNVEIGDPKYRAVNVRNKAIRLNLCDVYIYRSIIFQSTLMPSAPGEIVKLEEENRELVFSLKKHEESQASLYSSIETLQHKLKTLEQIQFIATVLITVSQEKLNGT